MTKIRESVALGVFAVLCAPSIVVAGDLSDPGVRNGSFCDPTNSDWMRSNPNLRANDDSLFCDESRLISIGRSVVHAPEYISDGNETSLPIPPEVPGDECTFPLDQRTSVLRMRANHPSTGLGINYEAAPTVANVYQTGITLVDPGNIEISDLDDLAVVLLRFDCFALHPVGGAALQVRLIAEKTEGCSPIDWGSSELVLPFGDWSSGSNCTLSHTMNVLGSPVYRTDCDDEHHEHWLPRQVPRTNPEGGCAAQMGRVDLVESLVRGILDDQDYPPSADWRTVEMRVDVRTLPGWDCDVVGLSQIGNYRFTIAFRLPEEWMVMDGGMAPCSIVPDCSLTPGGQNLIVSPRFPSYAELDQIELRLANLNASVASPCDLIKSEVGQCGSSSTSDPCRDAPDGQTIFGNSSFKPDSRDSDVSVLVDVEGTVSCGMESSRNNHAIVYDVRSGTDIVELSQTVNACSDCAPNSSDKAPIYRPITEDPFESAVVCAGDFTGDGVVDGADFGAMLAAWGACAGCPADLNGDGEVTGADVGLLLTMWGVCP